MVDMGMSVEDLASRAYGRGLPPRKWAKLAERWQTEHSETGEEASNEVIDSLFRFLPEPPALILNYLSTGLSLGLLSGRSVLVRLLYQQDSSPFPLATLATLCGIINTNLTGVDAVNPLPSSLETPMLQPDVGPSSQPLSERKWTLSLLLPLLRYCADPHLQIQVQPITQLLSRVLAVVAPYPAPPFDVGLEASQLMGALPDILSVPLRESLSGLMMDLAVSDGVARTQAAQQSHPQKRQTQDGQVEDGAPDFVFGRPGKTFGPVLPQAMGLLVENHRRSRHRARAIHKDGLPTSSAGGLVDLLKLSWRICEQGDIVLSSLLGVILSQVTAEPPALHASSVDAWLTLVEELPTALHWWKAQTDARLRYPDTLVAALQQAFEASKPGLDAHADWQSATWARFNASDEADEDASSFSTPEGWNWTGMRETLERRLADLGLLSVDDIGVILPGQQISPPWQNTGESLLQRVAVCPKSQLESLSFVIAYAPGASRSLAGEVIKTIEACPAVQPPEGLLSNLSSSPAILAALTASLPATALLDLATRHLVDKSEDANVRADDPQGSMTRFGEGVVFVETLAAQYQLPVPKLLQDGRKALPLQELSNEQQGMMNGWVKALFGSDGIDDETLLSTTPQDFCHLACGLFQQAIAATASGQIDLDTLHSGLSYFCQPLLSWSLGGIVTWLGSEIHRQGLLSALHIDVLQNLILSSALPDGLLRATGPEIAGLLAPQAGLQPVFQSANVSVDGIRTKLEAVGVPILPGPMPTAPLETFHAAVQVTRRFDFAPPDWAVTLLSSLTSSRETVNDVSTVAALLSELCNPAAAEMNQNPDDSLIPIASLLLLMSTSSSDNPLIETLVERNLPTLLDGHGQMFALNNPHPMVRAIRTTLILLDDVQPDLASRLVDRLVDELAYQQSRPSSDQRESNGPIKRAAAARRPRPLSSSARMTVDMLVKAFDDEDLKSKWAGLSRL